MTSGNVSNIPMPMAAGVSMSPKPEAKAGNEDFRNVMAKSYQSAPVSAQTAVSGGKAASVKVEVPKAEPVQSAGDAKKTENVAETLKDFEKDAKEILEEELDVTEEQVEEAMEVLGLTAVDLMDSKNVTALVAELKPCEDSVELLLDDSVAGVMQAVKELAKGVLEETGVSAEDLNRMLSEQVQTDDAAEVVETETPAFDADATEILAAQQTDKAFETVPREREMPEDASAVLTADVKAEQVREAKETSTDDDSGEETQNDQAFSKEAQTAPKEPSGRVSQETFARKTDTTGAPATMLRPDGVMQGAMQPTAVQYQPQTHSVVMESGQMVDVERIINQITEMARVTISNQSASLEMLLNPEGLGRVYLHLTQERGEVNARLAVENEAVKEALEHQMQQLKDNLNQQGIKVTAVEVSVGTHEFERNLEENMNHDRQMDEQRQQAGAGSKRQRNINLNDLDELQGLMTEEETLAAQIMRDNGNSVNYTA